jgi:hypothetical protein
MRIPSFYHCKEEPILVECIKYNPEIRYTQEQLSEHLPDIPVEISVGGDSPPTISTSIAGTQKGMIRVRCECCFLQHCKRNSKTLSEPQWYAKITNLAVFEGGDEAIHLFSKPHPNYSFEQTQNKINRFRKSGTKPITCAKIASHGFQCPNMGKCKVKFMGSVLADSLATNEQVIFCGDRFHFYEGGVYVPKEDVEAENFVRTFMSADNDKTYSQISDTAKQWKMQIYTNSNKVNANAYLINLKNGIYNIHTRQLSPHNYD